MKWSEIKQAIEQSDLRDEDEILEIRCELHDGDKTLHSARLGNLVRLNEHLSEKAQRSESAGVAT